LHSLAIQLINCGTWGPALISRIVLVAIDYAGIPLRKVSEKASAWQEGAKKTIDAKQQSTHGIIDRVQSKILNVLRIKNEPNAN